MPKKGKRKGKRKDGDKAPTADEPTGGAPAHVPLPKKKPEHPKGKGKGRNPELTAKMEAAAEAAKLDRLSQECPICRAKGGREPKPPSLVPKANVYGGFRCVDASLYGPRMFDGTVVFSVFAKDQAQVQALERKHRKKK